MSKRSRPLIDNVVYHIIVRGNQRQIVFNRDEDYRKYLKIVWKYKHKYDAKIYAYCLMNNHIHIIMQPSDKMTLKEIMHAINLSYSKWFNHKYEKCGHLWQERYKSFILQKDQYLLNCITYVELNPVRAQICVRAEEYPWSSYNARIFGVKNKLLDKLIL